MNKMSKLISTVAVLTCLGCGGKKSDDEKRPIDQCKDLCKEYDKCPGVEEDYLSTCNRGCEDAVDLFREADCMSEFRALLRCSERNFSCDGSPACEDLLSDLTACVSSEF
jgi:hypothetical protein